MSFVCVSLDLLWMSSVYVPLERLCVSFVYVPLNLLFMSSVYVPLDQLCMSRWISCVCPMLLGRCGSASLTKLAVLLQKSMLGSGILVALFVGQMVPIPNDVWQLPT